MINYSIKPYITIAVIIVSLIVPRISYSYENVILWCGLTVCMVGVSCMGAWMDHVDKKLTTLEKKQDELNRVHTSEIQTLKDYIKEVKDNLEVQDELQSQQKEKKPRTEKKNNVPDWLLAAD